MKKSLLKNLKDPEWRVSNLYRIIDKQARKIVFKPNAIQQKIIECKDLFKMILKARQFGVTTGECVRLFDKTIFNRNMTTCIIAHEQDAIKKIFSIVKKLYRFMHPEIQPRIDRGGGSKHEMYFPEINSKIYCDLESRGDTINHLHVSEAAFANPDRINPTMDAVPIDGYVTLESTPDGFGNHFYDKWVGSKHFAKLFFPWFLHPEYQIPTKPLVRTDEEAELAAFALAKYNLKMSDAQIMFRRVKIDTKGDLSFRQEYPENDVDCFLFSGTPAMKSHIVKELLETAPEPIEILDDIGGAHIFHHSSPKKTYTCGVDTASGVGEDYCVAKIFDDQTMEEQACLAGKWAPFEFAHLVNKLCQRYRKGPQHPLLVIESNNHGHAVLVEIVHHIRYPNIYYHNDDMDRPGWITDMVSRPQMINTFIDAVHNGHALLNSRETLKECLALVDNKGKIEATEGYHDDRVMASAIAITVISRKRSSIEVYNDLRRSILL
jgi:hypothetical protein